MQYSKKGWLTGGEKPINTKANLLLQKCQGSNCVGHGLILKRIDLYNFKNINMNAFDHS